MHPTTAGSEGLKKVKLPKAVYWLCLGQVLYSGLIFGYVTNISVVIQGDKLGNATEAGMAISVFTFGTLLAGIVFGRIKHLLPTLYLPVAFGMTGLGMAICYFSPNLTMIFIGSIIGGAGMGIGLPGVFSRVSDLTPKVIISAGVGLVVAGQGIGGIMGRSFFNLFKISQSGYWSFPISH